MLVRSWRSALETVTLFAMLLASLAMASVVVEGWLARRAANRALATLPRTLSFGEAATRGSADATVVLLEFGDYQCPFCASFARTTLPLLERDYIVTGKVRFVFMNEPLAIHPRSQPAAEAALCAARQGRFWAMHDWLYENQTTFDQANVAEYAGRLNIEPGALEACVRTHASAKQVKKDAELGYQLGVSGTPTFLIGTAQSPDSMMALQWVKGVLPYNALQEIIDDVLGQAGTKGPITGQPKSPWEEKR